MTDLKRYGYTETEAAPEGLLPARITAVHRGRYELITPLGPLYGQLKTGVYYGAGWESFPTAGDFILFRAVEGGDAQIVKTLPRKSQFIRRDPNPFAGDQIVAANADYVFIMSSLNHDFNVKRIERYLVLARQSNALPVIVLTKADLANDFTEQLAAAKTIAGNTEVLPVSAVSGIGLENLSAYLRPGKTVVFLGMSGVGKSSLLNALMERGVMAVQEIRADDSRGRHTTTHRELFMLPSGAMVIDTPGMRALGMWNAEDGVSETFFDVEALLGGCRFADCRHEAEPGCAVQEAIRSGALTAERWESYANLQREALYAVDRAAAMRKKQARNKAIAKWSKHVKKNGGFKQ